MKQMTLLSAAAALMLASGAAYAAKENTNATMMGEQRPPIVHRGLTGQALGLDRADALERGRASLPMRADRSAEAAGIERALGGDRSVMAMSDESPLYPARGREYYSGVRADRLGDQAASRYPETVEGD